MHVHLAPSLVNLPTVGFNEKTPQYPVGIRRLPPISEPTPIADPSIARSAASPPELPPHVCAALYGFVVTPQIGFEHSKESIV